MTDRNFSEIFAPKLDAAASWVRDTPYEADVPFTWRPTQATVLDIDGTAVPQDSLGVFAYKVAKTSLDEAEPTLAEFALMEYLGVPDGNPALATSDLPTSFHVTNTPGNQNGNGLRSNGVYRSNNAGPLNGSGFGNWTWRVKVTVIGNWITQHYFNDTGNNAFRDSFDGGASWSAWGS